MADPRTSNPRPPDIGAFDTGPPHTGTLDTDVTDHLLSTTRAVRKRLDLERPVSRELLLECLRLAVQSPTGSNSQGWHWIVVTDADKRRRIAEIYERDSRGYLESRAAAVDDPQTKRVYRSALYLLEILDRVPVHLIPCIEGRLRNPEPFAAAGFYGSILPAVWSFMLAARSRGLGTVWTTLHLAHEAEVAELLGIPDGFTQVALIPVAHFTGDDFRPAQRPPVEQITHWDRWAAT
jgi:nitroreductase